MKPDVKKTYDYVALAASAARTSDGNGSAVQLQGMVNAVAFVLDVTAAATDAGDLLDVYVQTKADGTNWLDVLHFTQIAGTGGTKRYVAKICAGGALTEFENGTALSAGGVRHILGDDWRVRWEITDLDASGDSGSAGDSGSGFSNASFTFGVTACPM